jgi:uncharacterized RDD family membrane protein YckC
MIENAPGSAQPMSEVPVPRPGSRLLSSLVDAVVAYVIITTISVVLVQAVLHPKPHAHLTSSQTVTAEFLTAIALVVAASVFVVIHAITGRSLGKLLLRLRLVTADGQRPSVLQLIVKYGVIFALLIVPFGPVIVLVAVAFALSQSRRRNAFDLLAKTAVIPVEAVAAPAD